MIYNNPGRENLSKVAAPGFLVEIVILDGNDYLARIEDSAQMGLEYSNKSGLVAEMETL